MPEPAITRNPRYIFAVIAGLFVLYIAAYSPALNGGFIWDDDYFVSRNPTLNSWAGLVKIWTDPVVRLQYYPLVHTSFWIENHLWGLSTPGFHLVNLTLHAINAWLLWRVLQRLKLPGAAFAAALFLLHPVEVESVAWITERKNVLSGMFYLLALDAWLRFDPLPPAAEISPVAPAPNRWYAAAFVLYVAALLSKSVTCSLPAVIALLIWWRRGGITRRDVFRLAPFFIVGIGLGVMTAWMEKKYVGASGDEFKLNGAERVLVAGRALWFYATKLVWPEPISFIYERWHVSAAAFWQWLFPLGAASVMVGLFLQRRRLGRGPLVAVLCFAGTLVPAIGFFNVYPHRFSFVADHFQYLAGVFLMVLLSAVLAPRIPARIRMLGAAIVLLACGGLVWRQAHAYQNLESLWRDTIAKNPDCWMAHYNYGNLLKSRGETELAIAHYRDSLHAYPNNAIALSNLAGALEHSGDFAEAETLHDKAVALAPNLPELYFNRGEFRDQQNRLGDAIADYETALRLDTQLVEARVNLANALLKQGREADAMAHYQRALEIDPANARTVNNFGAALARTGKPEQAIEQFARACALDPRYADAFVNWGMALNLQHQSEAAGEKYLRALELEPANATANFRIAELLAAAGQTPLAAMHYRRAIDARPDWPDALARCAWLLATTTDDTVRAPDEALKLSERALKAANSPAWLLDVRAAALAASKRFPEAIEFAARAETLSREQHHAEFADHVAARRKLYESGQAYREGPPPQK